MSGLVLPPVPSDFKVESSGAVTPLAEEPMGVDFLGGYVRHFSPSSLRMLKVCPEQYRQRYILGRKERPNGNLTVGTATHRAIGFNLEQKVASGVDRPMAEVTEYYHDAAWPSAVEDDGGLDEIRWDDKVDDVRHDGERMTMAYHKTVAPLVQPIAEPERKIQLWIDGVPVPFIGYLDIEEASNVADVKTGKQVQRKPDANWRFQGTMYSLATGKATHFHSVSRAKTPSIATPLTDPEMALPYNDALAQTTRQVLLDYVGQVEYFMNRHGPDEPWPQSGVFMDYRGGAACKYCGFRKFCPAWEWERVVHP